MLNRSTAIGLDHGATRNSPYYFYCFNQITHLQNANNSYFIKIHIDLGINIESTCMQFKVKPILGQCTIFRKLFTVPDRVQTADRLKSDDVI